VAPEIVSDNAKLAEVVMKRKVVLVKEDNKLNKHAYYKEYAKSTEEYNEYKLLYNSSSIIQKFARRKLAYKELKWLKLLKRTKKTLKKFMRKTAPKFRRWRKAFKSKAISKIQALCRGIIFRIKFHDGNPCLFM
jgi:hypothetical protein